MGDSRFWSKDFIIKFIDLYRSFPCLWKIKSKEYTNRNLKNLVYEKLADICKSIYPEANRDYVVKRIQSFRGSFRKELKKVEDSKRSGAGTEEIYTPTLWYFELMKFTLDQELPTPSIYNLNEDSELEEEFREGRSQEEFREESSQEEGTKDDDDLQGMNHAQILAGSSTSDQLSTKQAVRKKRSRTSTKNKTQNEFITYCKRQLEKNDSLDEYDASAISWAKKLKRMNPMQAIYADMHINRIVNLGLLNQLTNNIDFPPQSPIFSSHSSHCGETSNLPYSDQVHPPNDTSDSSQPIQPSGIATYYAEASETILNL